MASSKMHHGGCQCGAVRFEVTADLGSVISCNCSICSKHGLLLTFVPSAQFKITSGEARLVEYLFNKKVIRHLFCRTCGVEPFGRGAAPDGAEMIAVNVRCLDGIDVSSLKLTPFDGKSL